MSFVSASDAGGLQIPASFRKRRLAGFSGGGKTFLCLRSLMRYFAI
jgi:hypothetical protein